MTDLMAGQPDRWKNPFGGQPLTDEEVAKALSSDQFATMNTQGFSKLVSLENLIRYDARLVTYQRGDLVTIAGDYGNSVFFLLSGNVEVFVDKETDPAQKLHRTTPKSSAYQALSQLWKNDREPEVRRYDATKASNLSLRQAGHEGNNRAYIADMDSALAQSQTVTLTAGTMFGEISALARTPRTATIIANGDVEILEMRWQGLREIRKRNAAFRAHLDDLYRTRSLLNYLSGSAYFENVSPEALQEIVEKTTYETYGTFEWTSVFRKHQDTRYQVSADKNKGLIEAEPVLVHEGHVIDGLIIVRQGFARLTNRYDQGHLTKNYLTSGAVFGLAELVASQQTGQQPIAQQTVRAVGYVDALHIPADLVLKYIIPHLKPELIPDVSALVAQTADDDIVRWKDEQPFLNFIVDNRVINGTAAMFIDTDRCVNCDDCVKACAVNHNGNPRFIRHGPTFDHWNVANACMHCVDPVCLIGCPTGAINRDAASGHILISDPLCIGCGTCASSCPYGNIRMVEARHPDGSFMVDDKDQKVILKATKCDLCAGQPSGPACENACPHGALKRVDLRDTAKLEKIKNEGPAKASRRRLIGAGATLAGLGAFWGIGQLLEDGLYQVASYTGWTLFYAMSVLVLFHLRKRFSMLPLLKASTWAQVHIYLGLVAVGIFATHTHFQLPSSVLGWMLWLLFVLTSLSGMVGLYLSRALPKRLNSGGNRSGERLLFERIPALGAELEQEVQALCLAAIKLNGSEALNRFYQDEVVPHFAARRNFLAHLCGWRGPIRRMHAQLNAIEHFLDEETRAYVPELRQMIEAKDNLDFQYTLQFCLKGWLLVHLPLSIGAYLLPIIHIIVVYAFSMGAL